MPLVRVGNPESATFTVTKNFVIVPPQKQMATRSKVKHEHQVAGPQWCQECDERRVPGSLNRVLLQASWMGHHKCLEQLLNTGPRDPEVSANSSSPVRHLLHRYKNLRILEIVSPGGRINRAHILKVPLSISAASK